jgi:hypothetical protein
MEQTRRAGRYFVTSVVAVGWAALAAAQVPDHLQCYKVRDPLKLRGVVDLDTAQFGAETGCSVSRTSLFCVPARKAVVSAEDRATGAVITPLEFWSPPEPGDLVCYKARCPRPFPADQQVTDQFGTRTLESLRPSLLCAPAVKGSAPDADQVHAFPATGQTSCRDATGAAIPCTGTGQDGDIQAGSTLSYVDNGDGTITDLNTGLTWEKKSDDGSIHDKDTLYTWTNAFAVHVAGLNAGSFAGHNDWRMPNVKELQSIINYENLNPSVSPEFNSACLPGCTVSTCSCTKAANTWTSTTNMNFPLNAWTVDFQVGFVRPDDKTVGDFVRAVRGGA